MRHRSIVHREKNKRFVVVHKHRLRVVGEQLPIARFAVVQRRLSGSTSGNIKANAHHAARISAGIALKNAANRFNPSIGAVGMQDARFVLIGCVPCLARFLHFLQHPIAIIGMQPIKPNLAISAGNLRRVAQHGEVARREKPRVGYHVPIPHPDACRIGGQRHALCCLQAAARFNFALPPRPRKRCAQAHQQYRRNRPNTRRERGQPMPRREHRIHRLAHRHQQVRPCRQGAIGDALCLAVNGAAADDRFGRTRRQALTEHGAVAKHFAHACIVKRAAHQQRAIVTKQGDGAALAAFAALAHLHRLP